MRIIQAFHSKNAANITNKQLVAPMKPFLHSTGANNPKLSRYCQDQGDGVIGANAYGNHWNVYHPGGKDIGPHTYVSDGKGKCKTCGGIQVAVHGFIGKLADGSIATVQSAPWGARMWHAGGSANNSYIGMEICEDGLLDATYFNAVYNEAVEVYAYLCKDVCKCQASDIICHSEGYKKGIASNHADVMHWFPKHGKSMDTFRADVAALMATPKPSPTPTPTGNAPSAWAKTACDWAIAQGLFAGDGKGNYDWKGTLTREMLAQVLYNQAKK